MKLSAYILFFHLFFLLASCTNINEKRRQDEIKEFMEISEFLDNEIKSRILILEQNLSRPEFFLQLKQDKRQEAKELYGILDSSLSTISNIQSDLKYFYNQHKGKRTDLSETEFFKGEDTILAHIIKWTINKLNDKENKHFYLQNYLSNELKNIAENKNFFSTEYKNISIPLAIAHLSQLKQNLLFFFHVLADHKYRLFSHNSTDYTRLIPMVVSRKDCIKIGEKVDAEIFVGSFIYSSNIEMYCTKLTDSESKSAKEPFQKN